MDNGCGKKYCKITVEGIVQGVGFRPFVYRTALKWGIVGSAANIGGFVEIFAAGKRRDMKMFLNEIESFAPPMSKIEKLTVETIDEFTADGFFIKKSGDDKSLNSFVSPDLAICDECEREIFDCKDRRFHHFFNSCVNCGPRFSVIEKLPYDRTNTSMREFGLCPDCEREYTAPKTRRFRAETVCCNGCGPVLSYIKKNGASKGYGAFEAAATDLENGRIIAVKGIGGYHLACSPFSGAAVRSLRELKGRESKPFAIMFKNIDKIKEICSVGEDEEYLLKSNPRPIVLLDVLKNIFSEYVLQNDARCGCFLPYTPLHCQLLERFDSLVMTSANLSGEAIIYDDAEMAELFLKSKITLFSGVLTNDRKIVRSAEDSVAQINSGGAQIIRRARGLAPTPFPLKTEHNKDFLAVGGDLKSAFCLVKNGYAYVSQYIGDLEDVSAFERFERELAGYMPLFNANPQFVVCDAHPGYFSTGFAESLGLPVVKIRHHFAHAASVLAEHGIYDDAVAVCFDGTGYGTDGCIWGGEFLIFRGNDFERAGHLNYVELLGGDGAATDAKKTAVCYLINSGVCDLARFDDRLESISAALNAGVNTVKTSSAGRLFDAVSAILGICGENKYEGQCASALQQAAESAVKNHIRPLELSFDIAEENGMYLIDPKRILKNIYTQANNAPAAALGFHTALAEAAGNVCKQISKNTGIKTAVLSGGVFQNRLLTQMTVESLQKSGMRVYINNLSSPNDGGISLGQAYIGGNLCV